jgi:FkbM family methyltransferase
MYGLSENGPDKMTVRIASAAEDFYREFSGGSAGRKRYLYGINEYSASIVRIMQVDGFIDDFSVEAEWMGRPVLKFREIDPDCMIVSCTTSNYTHTVMDKIRAAGIACINYIAFADASRGVLPQVSAVADSRQDYAERSDKYVWLRGRLFDEESRNVLDRLLDFRLHGNVEAMRHFEYAASRQYFEPFVVLEEGEVFVDGGGFDGCTSLEFTARCPQYGAIHLFEPSPSMLTVAREKLAGLERVHFHPLGLFDRSASLAFDASAGSASHISDVGFERIEVARLDDTVPEAVSFIKLDLEGAELAALRGMERQIRTAHPKLAVAVYHRPSDFWGVPELILDLRSDYDVYLRHYTEGWAETIMFFIPQISRN